MLGNLSLLSFYCAFFSPRHLKVSNHNFFVSFRLNKNEALWKHLNEGFLCYIILRNF